MGEPPLATWIQSAACVHTWIQCTSHPCPVPRRQPRPAPPAPSRAATGFDPIGFISDPAKKEEMQMKELANGRLAMFAFGGAVTQAVLTGNTFPWLYSQ